MSSAQLDFIEKTPAELSDTEDYEDEPEGGERDVHEVQEVDADDEGQEGYIWSDARDLAYTLSVQKGGGMALTVRLGSLRAILEQMVEWLVKPPGVSAASVAMVEEQLKFFLCSHERVITTQKLLGRLNDIFWGKDVNSALLGEDEVLRQEGVWRFINFWLDASYYPDFVGYDGNNTPAMAALHHFILATFKDDDMPKRKELLARITSTLPWLRPQEETTNGADRGQMNARRRKFGSLRNKKLPEDYQDLTLLEFSAEEAAQAITRLDAMHMRKIKRDDLLYKKFENLKADRPHSYYVAYADRLKKFSFWCASVIILEERKKYRVRLWKRLLLIARILQEEHRNLSSSSAILSGLTRLAVTRLRDTFKDAPQENKDLLKEMQEDLMGFSDNWARNVISDAIANGQPCIPTVDIMRKDVLRIDEGSKGDRDERGLLKFFKLVSFGKAIHFIEQAYSHPYHFETPFLEKREQTIYDFFRVMPNTLKNTDVLMKMSFKLEPPSATEAKSKIYRKYIEPQEQVVDL